MKHEKHDFWWSAPVFVAGMLSTIIGAFRIHDGLGIMFIGVWTIILLVAYDT